MIAIIISVIAFIFITYLTISANLGDKMLPVFIFIDFLIEIMILYFILSFYKGGIL